MKSDFEKVSHIVTTIFMTFLLSCWALSSSASLAQDQDSPQQPQAKPTEVKPTEVEPIEVNKNQKTPILIYDTSGGKQIALVQDRVPKFQLFADGRVVAGGNPGTQLVNGQLSDADLAALLKFVINENNFLRITQKDIEAKMGKPKFQFVDAPFTKFAVDIKQGKNTVSIYAMFNATQTHPGIDELQRLKKIEQRLNLISGLIHLGDDSQEVLDFVNQAVKRKTPAPNPNQKNPIQPTAFTIQELAMATRSLEGRLQVRFTRGDQSVIYVRKKDDPKPHLSFFGWPTTTGQGP